MEFFYISVDETYLTIGLVSQNLVTQTNFVEFRDIRIFMIFGASGAWSPKNGIFEKNLESGK